MRKVVGTVGPLAAGATGTIDLGVACNHQAYEVTAICTDGVGNQVFSPIRAKLAITAGNVAGAADAIFGPNTPFMAWQENGALYRYLQVYALNADTRVSVDILGPGSRRGF